MGDFLEQESTKVLVKRRGLRKSPEILFCFVGLRSRCTFRMARPQGPTCHKGTTSCFESVSKTEDSIPSSGILETLLERVNQSLSDTTKPSLTRSFIERGAAYNIRKLKEVAIEVGLAISYESRARQVEEVADLLYRSVVLLKSQGIELGEIQKALDLRSAESKS